MMWVGMDGEAKVEEKERERDRQRERARKREREKTGSRERETSLSLPLSFPLYVIFSQPNDGAAPVVSLSLSLCHSPSLSPSLPLPLLLSHILLPNDFAISIVILSHSLSFFLFSLPPLSLSPLSLSPLSLSLSSSLSIPHSPNQMMTRLL